MEFRALTRILKIGVKMLPSRKSWSFTIQFYWHLSKSWSQIKKVGVKNSKFGVNETSGIISDARSTANGSFQENLYFRKGFQMPFAVKENEIQTESKSVARSNIATTK